MHMSKPARNRFLLLWCQRTGLAAMLLAISACTMMGSVANVVASSTANMFSGSASPSFLDWQAITLVAAPDLNQNSPLALDLVFVRDQATLDILLALPASKWFGSKASLMKTYPNAFTVRSWELVPSQFLQLSEQELGSPRVAGMLMYANYFSPGEHRAQLPLSRVAYLVELGAFDFVIKTRPR